MGKAAFMKYFEVALATALLLTAPAIAAGPGPTSNVPVERIDLLRIIEQTAPYELRRFAGPADPYTGRQTITFQDGRLLGPQQRPDPRRTVCQVVLNRPIELERPYWEGLREDPIFDVIRQQAFHERATGRFAVELTIGQPGNLESIRCTQPGHRIVRHELQEALGTHLVLANVVIAGRLKRLFGRIEDLIEPQGRQPGLRPDVEPTCL